MAAILDNARKINVGSAIGFQFSDGHFAEVKHNRGRPSRHVIENGRVLDLEGANPDLKGSDIILFDRRGFEVATAQVDAEGKIDWI